MTSSNVLTFRGIVSHINYRQTGKWDLGPAFDWTRVIYNVTTPTFAQPKTRSFEWFDAPLLQSEDELIPLLPQPRSAIFEDEPYDLPETEQQSTLP